MADQSAACATLLVDLIPHLMQVVRQGMRCGGGGEGLSIPQFRTLAMVSFHPGTSLSDAAAHVGLGAPAMSVIVDGLVRRNLLNREPAATDRRRNALVVTAGGRRVLVRAHAAAKRLVAARLSALASVDLTTIATATSLLQNVFAPEHP